jgi:hypothetical protein
MVGMLFALTSYSGVFSARMAGLINMYRQQPYDHYGQRASPAL